MSGSNKLESADYRLKNLTNALYLTDSDDVALRTGIDGNINVAGDINVPGNVQVYSSPEDPIHVHLTELGTFGNLTTYLPVHGIVQVNNFPTSTTITSGNLSIYSMPAVTNNGTFAVQATQSGTWYANINNFPTSTTITSGNIGIYGNIAGITTMPSLTIASMPEVEIKNDSGNPISISANSTVNSTNNPIYVKGTSDTSFFAPTQSDAFGRLRVSNPFTLFESFNRYRDNGLSSNSTAGTSSISFNANAATISMTVGTANGDSAIRESNRVFAYQPGKSLLVLTTFTFNAAKTNLTQRVGYFDTQNGFYLEQVGSTINFVKRSNTTGSIIETRKAQSEWSQNTLLPSGLDLTKSQIFWIDIEWLGVGTARMGFVIDGQLIECHRWHHANYATGAYMTTACLPIRKEIFNTGTTSGSSTLTSICSAVISEGGYELKGRAKSAGHPIATPALLPTKEVEVPIISIRLKSSNLNGIVLPNNFTIGVASQANYVYKIYRNAITSGGTWVDAGSDTNVEYNLGPTAIVSGTVAEQSYIMASNQTSASVSSLNVPFKYQLERNRFTGTAYEFLITITSSAQQSSVYAGITWEDVT